jgi:hypothetical protein
VTPDAELELRALCGIAWERRAEPDFCERVAAIIDWFDRRDVRAFECRQRSRAAVLQVLRETAPAARLEELPPECDFEGDEPQEWTGDELPAQDWHGDELPLRPTGLAV